MAKRAKRTASKGEPMTQIELDVSREAMARLNTWDHDTRWRIEAADINIRNGIAMILQVLLSHVAWIAIRVEMSEGDFLRAARRIYRHQKE